MRRTSLLALALALAACGGSDVLDTLEQHRRTWADAALASYEYELEVDCFCPDEVRGPFRVTVQAGEVIGLVRTSSPSDPAAADELLDGTIEGLFGLIEANADANVIDVVYDVRLGYPSSVIVDPSAAVIDDELSIYIRDFQPTNG